MPKRTAGREIFSEKALARRLAHERELRGWSYEGLARRMTEAGCPIDQSALFKVEKGNPPRRITVDELVALTRVFGLSANELLVPPELAAASRAADLVAEWFSAADARITAAVEARKQQERQDRAREAIRKLLEDEPKAAAGIEVWLEHHAKQMWPKADASEAVDHYYEKLVGGSRGKSRAKA
jgi:transcriptional regulator with XRE-family HTH domain